MERIQDYIAIDHEPKPSIGGEPPAYWPTSGDIKVENLSARYSADGPKVLHDLSFHIKSGERIGVGKTMMSFYIFTSHCLLQSDAPEVERYRIIVHFAIDKIDRFADFTHTLASPWYPNRRNCLLRWHSHQFSQSGRDPV